MSDLSDFARPLVYASGLQDPRNPRVIQQVPLDPRIAFTPANRQAGWITAERLFEQQRRLQNKG